MVSYYCPFCSSRYQFQKIKNDGILVCSQCGDPLIKKKIIYFKQIFGIFSALSFLAPLFILITFTFNDFRNEQLQKNSDSLVQFISNKKWNI